WATEVTAALLDAKNTSEVKSGIELANLLKIPAAAARLRILLQDQARPLDQRQAAAGALVRLAPEEHMTELGKVLTSGAEPAVLRAAVAKALAETNLPAARAELVQ